MCKECGCESMGKNTRLQFIVKGYTSETAKKMEEILLGMSGVLFVHIHANEGETTVDYNPAKTKLLDIVNAFETQGLEAVL
ncbi:heavy-metal-associated domain-containing protein [Pectinatus sottacetonis]|uniref:heavy-metal-associated domain-containing protein n=1 Tax=Pectinatus sottacetonis TaxID=1002795 RepID=UPI0018C78C6E|nr:heavy-metal-associated domain-containing protein [Pectinatus sottacetonis]